MTEAMCYNLVKYRILKMFIALFSMDLLCDGIFYVYHINRLQDNTVATELFFLKGS